MRCLSCVRNLLLPKPCELPANCTTVLMLQMFVLTGRWAGAAAPAAAGAAAGGDAAGGAAAAAKEESEEEEEEMAAGPGLFGDDGDDY